MGDFEREVMLSLGRIEEKVDGAIVRSADDRAYLRITSERVGRLERAEARRKGVAATIAASVSAVVAVIAAALKGLLS